MIYFDNAATSRFKPPIVGKTLLEQLNFSANPGRSGHTDSIRLGIAINKARENLKAKFNADDSYEVIYTSNCSEALNLAILGYCKILKDKVHVISSLNEHNSVLRPLRQLELQGIINTTYLAPNQLGVITPNQVDNAIKIDTKLVVLNHTSNVTGATCDIEEIGKVCKRRGVKLLIDGAQSLGHTPINMIDYNIDMLAGAGHKGIHGVQGVGFLIMRRDIELIPLKFGGTGTASESVDPPTMLPESLECGTLNSPAILAMDSALNWTYDNYNALHRHYRQLASELYYGMRHLQGISLYSSYPSDVVSLNILDYSSSEMADYFNSQNIAVRSGLHCAPFIHKHLGTLERGAVRISIGYNNSMSDINTLLKAIERVTKS